jgi:hypothetical protein
MPSQYSEALKRELYGLRGGHQSELQAAMDDLPPQAAQQLLFVIRDLKQELQDAERTYRSFPGGPKIRI